MSEPIDISSIIEQIEENNTELTTLELRGWEIGLYPRKAAVNLLCALERNTTLTTLPRFCNSLGKEAHSKIKKLMSGRTVELNLYPGVKAVVPSLSILGKRKGFN